MSAPEYDTARPYVASYVIFRQAEKIAFVLRAKGWMAGHYGLISGKKENGESNTHTAAREGGEEAGVVIEPQDLKFLLVMDRLEPSSGQMWTDFFFEALKWKGELHNAEPDAHLSLDSFPMANMPENTVPSVRFALEAIEAGKTYVEYGWD